VLFKALSKPENNSQHESNTDNATNMKGAKQKHTTTLHATAQIQQRSKQTNKQTNTQTNKQTMTHNHKNKPIGQHETRTTPQTQCTTNKNT
jgi:hypothetical protein